MSRTDGPAPGAGAPPEAGAFREAARAGRFLLPRCRACGRLHWYPRGSCPFCLSADIAWEASRGHGRIYSVTAFHRAEGILAIAYVELDEGLGLLTNVLAEDPAGLAIGQRVAVSFAAVAGDPDPVHPFFRPVAEP